MSKLRGRLAPALAGVSVLLLGWLLVMPYLGTNAQPPRDKRPRDQFDQEPDRNKWEEPFVSANDGTAGVAWLMELAHHVKELPTKVGVDFVLFDGEEWVFDGPYNAKDRYFLGSERFAALYKQNPPKHR